MLTKRADQCLLAVHSQGLAIMKSEAEEGGGGHGKCGRGRGPKAGGQGRRHTGGGGVRIGDKNEEGARAGIEPEQGQKDGRGVWGPRRGLGLTVEGDSREAG